MQFVPAAKCARLAMVYAIGTTEAINTLWFRVETNWDPASLLELCDGMFDNWVNFAKILQSDQQSLVKITARDMSVPNGYAVERGYTDQKGAINSSPLLPMNCTGAIKFGTPFAGRSFRGRNYWVGLLEKDVVGDWIQENFRTLALAGYRNLPNGVSGGNLEHVVVSQYSNKQIRANAVVTPVTYYSFDGVVDSQRRRLSGRGR